MFASLEEEKTKKKRKTLSPYIPNLLPSARSTRMIHPTNKQTSQSLPAPQKKTLNPENPPDFTGFCQHDTNMAARYKVPAA